MNEHCVFDYKKPIGKQNDYRTSSYRGHIRLMEQVMPPNMKIQLPQQPREEQPRKSEHQSEFNWKGGDPNAIRNPTLHNVKFMKAFEETCFRSPPKPMHQVSSVFRRDYKYKPKSDEEKPPHFNMMTAVESNKNLLINRAKPGHGKLLDPSATTSNLSYLAYSPHELKISNKDNITFWNWKGQKNNVFKIKEIMCDFFKSKECPKRRREYPSSLKHVPNRGLTTEFRTNYNNKMDCLNYDVSVLKNKLESYSEGPIMWESENRMYGSGMRIQKYIQ